MATQVTISAPWSEGTLEVVDLNGREPEEETPSETSVGTWWESESPQTSVVQTSDYASDSSLNSERYRKKRTPVKRRQVEKSLLSDAFPAISVRCHQVNEACEESHLPAQCHVLIAAPRFPTPAPRRPLSEPGVWAVPSTPPVVARSASWEKETRRPRQRRNVLGLVDSLLLDIYRLRRPSLDSDSGSCALPPRVIHGSRLHLRSVSELRALAGDLETHVEHMSAVLLRQLRRRDALRGRQERHCAVVTAMLQAKSQKRSEDARMRFSVAPSPGDSGFNQWRDAMRMVARLPGGIPPEFRRRLWLTLAERHLQATGVDWSKAHRLCFNEWSNPDDEQLGVQIVKDLHRTGCSLFCGAEAEQNQALLKRVLLAYARWNKAVGYCQGFNMLAALILQVMDRSETDSVKVMIYLVEGVLPESYFANNLRGLSVDMAVFRDLLSRRLPALSRHLERLQLSANDGASGTSYEPPLTNVFTMQWFLTLFSNCLPQPAVLRVWDLIFLEGNEVLLRTALAIWDGLADRILAVNSADEFYSIMGVLTREMLEFGLMDTNNLVKTVVSLAPFPFPELPELRDKYLYNITPWTQSVSTAARRGLKIFYSDDDEDMDEDDEKIAVAAAYGISTVFRSPRRRDSVHREHPPSLPTLNYSGNVPDKERLALDISALKQQYAKLRERQRQAHIILTAACTRQTMGPSAPTPVAMNHLLLGKSALLNVRGRRVGPPAGAVPPPVNNKNFRADVKDQLVIPKGKGRNQQISAKAQGETLHWKDAVGHKKRKDEETSATENETAKVLSSGSSDSSSSSTSTELCDEPDRLSDFDSEEATSLSDASSYIPSQSPHLPSGTSTATPEGFTLMSVSPIKEQPAQEIDYAVPSIRLDIAEDRVSESSSGYSASFSDQKTPLEDSSTDVDFPVVEPISTFVALEQISPEVHHPHACLPPFEDIPFGDIDVASYDNSLSPVISQTNKTELPNAEEVTGTSEYDADMSAIMEINQRLHGIHDRSKVGSGQQDEDVAEVMNDLLSLDQRMNSGRRNSERALKIIQENSEILQRILQCQKRRLSEESSNNVSEEDSVPSSTSAENVTFDVASSTHSQESLISSGERTHSYYRDPTKETTSGEAIDVSPFFSTSRYSHLSGIGSVSEGPVNTPEKSAKSRTPSPEALTRGDYTRDKTLAEVPSFLKDISPFPMSSNTIDENRFLRNRTVSDLTDESSLSLDNCGSKFIALKSPELEPPSKQKDFVSEFLPKEDLVSLTEKFSTERFISEYSTHGKLFGSSLSERNVMEGKTSADLENESSKQSRISKFSDVDDLIRGRVDLEIPDDRFGCSESVGESRGDETSRLYGSGSRFEEFFRFDSAESRPSEAVERTLPHIAKSDSKSDFSHGSRPPSPTVTEMLNRSPSPLDYGFSGRNADHASPPRSPLFRYAASPSRGRERPASLFLTQDSSSFELLDHKGRLSPLYKSLSLLSVNDDKQKPKKKDKSPMRRRTSTDLTSFSFSKIKSPVAISPVKSPSRQRDLGLYPPIKQQGSPSKSPLHFSPFPHRTSTWQPKELGIKLGLYSTDEGSKARKS